MRFQKIFCNDLRGLRSGLKVKLKNYKLKKRREKTKQKLQVNSSSAEILLVTCGVLNVGY